MDTLQISGKIGLSNDSWAFRFMLDKQQAYRDFSKYFPQFCIEQEAFTIKEKEIPYVAAIYSMFPLAERERVLQQAVVHTYACQQAFLDKVAEKLVMQSDMTVAECTILLTVAPSLSSHTVMMLIQKAHQLLPGSLFNHFLLNPDIQHDMLLSYVLIHGDSELKKFAQKTIMQNNKGASLHVLDYATKKGMVASLTNGDLILIDNFRQGIIHKTAFKKIQTLSNLLIERIEPTDPIFNFDITHKEEFLFAIHCLYSKNPEAAKIIFGTYKKHMSIYELFPAGPIIWEFPELCSFIMTRLYSLKTAQDIKKCISIITHMPDSWKEHLKREITSQPMRFSPFSTTENTLKIIIAQFLNVSLPNLKDVNIDCDIVELCIKKTPYQQLLSWDNYQSMMELGLSIHTILEHVDAQNTIQTIEEIDIFMS